MLNIGRVRAPIAECMSGASDQIIRRGRELEPYEFLTVHSPKHASLHKPLGTYLDWNSSLSYLRLMVMLLVVLEA